MLAFLLGAERVLAIDTVTERLELAKEAGAETIDFMKEDVYERIMELTHGRGADACIDAVGTEAETMASADSMLDRAKTATFMGTDRPHVLRQAIHCCRNFGVVSSDDCCLPVKSACRIVALAAAESTENSGR